ncbi:hypothetical protein DFH94DRAFT_700280 [Russula ochroleuca]|uniref:Uncharacterized protein n=1 Tax=Russula ochroleuca TaxID=152965 RepID=A0A9P5JTI3_9AGAM|nr:hypothetical protein DFH94DRAFT_700280 [Russula ochroleuca]
MSTSAAAPPAKSPASPAAPPASSPAAPKPSSPRSCLVPPRPSHLRVVPSMVLSSLCCLIHQLTSPLVLYLLILSTDCRSRKKVHAIAHTYLVDVENAHFYVNLKNVHVNIDLNHIYIDLKNVHVNHENIHAKNVHVSESSGLRPQPQYNPRHKTRQHNKARLLHPRIPLMSSQSRSLHHYLVTGRDT